MALSKEKQLALMENLIAMIEETLFTKEQELLFANFQKMIEKEWEVFAEKNKHEIKILTAKLKFYQARLENMKK